MRAVVHDDVTAIPAVLCGFTDSPTDTRGSGLFGAFHNTVVPGVGLLEAGQPATGSMLRWFQKELGGERSLQGENIVPVN